MTSSDTPNPAFSKFTMALLKDSGWYDVDFEKAENFLFGWKEGCGFLSEDCYDSAGEPNFP